MSDPIISPPTSTAEYYPHVAMWVARPPRQRYWLHALLFLLTIFTTLVVGTHMQLNFQQGLSVWAAEDTFIPYFPIASIWHRPSLLLLGIPFSASLMLILLAHEMGHYLYCVHYRVHATLPFFIPVPTLIGTMGAFIRIRSPIRSRPALFDIGIAGPIAGFAVACVIMAVSLGMSHALPAANGLEQDLVSINYPLIFELARRVLLPVGLLHGASTLPLANVSLHPMAVAAWVGMFATALNLLPGGQLDGGHIVFSIAPRAHRIISRLTILVLIPLAVYSWVGWLVWAILLEISSFRHPQVAEWPKVMGVRRWLAGFAVIMLILTMTPAPFAHSSLKEIAAPVVQPLKDHLRESFRHWRGR